MRLLDAMPNIKICPNFMYQAPGFPSLKQSAENQSAAIMARPQITAHYAGLERTAGGDDVRI